MHPLQSKSWEKTRNELGVETYWIDGFLLSLHKIPFTDFKIGYIPRSSVPSKKTIKNLFDFGIKNKLIFIKIEPYEEKSPKNNLLSNNPMIVRSKHPLFPDWTQVLDLTLSEDELIKKMHPKTRYNIRLAEKKGVKVVEESNTKGFETFSKLYFETTKRQKYFGHNHIYHQSVWKNMQDEGAHILIAYFNKIPLAAYELWYMDEIIYYVYGGTSDQYRNLMASNLLMWEAVKLGKKLGAKKFDMWGSLPENYAQNHPWAGFTRFKQGYGTKFVEFTGSYDLVINPLLYKIYNLIYLVREAYLKFIS